MVQLNYYCKEKIYSPYPTNTLGHLYYRNPPQDRPRVSGSFRFRVLPSTSDSPESFDKGADLLRPDGRPWELPLYSAVHSEGYAPLIRKILNEKLLEPELLDTIADLPRVNLKVSSGVLYTLSDPFTLSLGQAKMITIITEKHLVTFRFRPLLDPPLGQHPFTGILLSNNLRRIQNQPHLLFFIPGAVLARFEKSKLPEHMHEHVVVIRVLDILSPIKCVIPDYDFDVQMPDVGQLITKRHSLFGDYHPWSINISEGSTSAAKCLGLLYP